MLFVSTNRGKKCNTIFFKCYNTNLVFEDKVLRRIFGTKRGKVTGSGKKKLHYEELSDL